MNMIEINNLVKKYHKTTVTKIDKFNFIKGKTYLLIGENGSGKSTLIKLILNLIKPTSGSINLMNNEIGFIPERVNFPEFVSVKTFLKNLLLIRNYESCFIDHKIDEYLKEWELEDKLIFKLSKGMRQKLLIIQAIIHNPKVYIFDEPLNGLDKFMQKKFMNYVKFLKIHKKTIIITTHYYKLYKGINDYLIEIIEGKIHDKSG